MSRGAETFQQLTREAVAALDPSHPDHDQIDQREWLRTARAALAEQDTEADAPHPRLRRRSS